MQGIKPGQFNWCGEQVTTGWMATASFHNKMRSFSDIAPCSIVGVDRRFRGAHYLHYQGCDEGSTLVSFITLMMEAVRTSETSVYSETTRLYIPEGSHLHTRRRENPKSHIHSHAFQVIIQPSFFYSTPCFLNY
jgi:hypothetical protein